MHTARFLVEANGATAPGRVLRDAGASRPAAHPLVRALRGGRRGGGAPVRRALPRRRPTSSRSSPSSSSAASSSRAARPARASASKLDFRIELGLPGGADTVANRVVAGNLTAIGLAAGQVTRRRAGEDEAARVLARLAFHYLDRWNRSDEELAALLRVVPIRPSVSTCLVQSAVEVEYAGGDPLYPVRYDWKGLAIDADRRPSAPVGIENDAAERDFLLASGLEGSVLEHRLFEDDLERRERLHGEGAAARRQRGIEVLDLGPENAESVLAGLPLDEGVKDEIREAAARGYRIRVPAAPARRSWRGRASAT